MSALQLTRRFRAALLTVLSVAPVAPVARLAAQGNRPLTLADYDRWRSIQGAALSADGKWAAFTLNPQVGDGELVVRSTSGATEYRIPRGFTGRPQLMPNADSGFNAPPAQFSADGRWVAVTTYAPMSEFEQARRAKRETPRASMTLLNTTNGQVSTVARVRSFRMARENARYLAYLMEADSAADTTRRCTCPGAQPGAAAAAPGGQARPVAGDSARGGARGRRRDYGTTLVLRDLQTGQETRIADVTAFAFDDSAKWLGYTISSRARETNGAFARALSDGRVVPLTTGDGVYRSLVFDRSGRRVAFLTDRDEVNNRRPSVALYAGTVAEGKVSLVSRGADSLRVAERGRLDFTRDGSAILFGVAPAPLDSVPADSLADKAVFDLWHFNDTRLPWQQRLEAGRDRDRSYTAIYRFDGGRTVVLGNDTLPRIELSWNGAIAYAATSVPYALESMWGGGGSDLYIIDPATGLRTLVARKNEFGRFGGAGGFGQDAPSGISPNGRYVMYFHDGRWFSYDVAKKTSHDLTGTLAGVRFDRETNDVPDTPDPWGLGGFTKGDASVLAYSRYDVWELDPAGVRAPRVVTDSVGVRRKITFRVADLDRDDPAIDPAKPLLLRAVDEGTKASGFWRDRLGVVRAPEQIMMVDKAIGQPQRARNAEVYLVTEETYRDSPNLYTGTKLEDLHKISDANPQQAEYRWGTAELVHWNAADGTPLDGILYKPQGFDPSKKYPMLVTFYEQSSQTLHNYQMAVPRNSVSATWYTSQGYLVFNPDIHYITGHPGQSALNSVVPGVQSLIAKGFVDPKGIGLGGQSWGGYQIAYIVTQTDMFNAAFEGAPVANMVSAYGGIRYESGFSRVSQYERGQSRLGRSLWEPGGRELFLENSPVFYLDRVKTPILIMSNDADGAVPHTEGIQMFVALKRLGKEVYLLNYNGDGHNPRKRANQKDVAMRISQFYDTHLRGAPAPDWMKRGIPFLQKGRDQIAPAITTTGSSPDEEPMGNEPEPNEP